MYMNMYMFTKYGYAINTFLKQEQPFGTTYTSSLSCQSPSTI